ncbi:MAG: HlyD family type I secretion periplasmic adaptor subunit [Magnetococcales bacterium]|nr:HlyD family type I secretion periplasmic adaptor subunit [Magnetococcales bacterium]
MKSFGDVDDGLIPVTDAARRRKPRGAATLLLGVIVGLVTAFVVWADFAGIDRVTKAQGRVVPAQKTQRIQNLEGGILAEKLVAEGQSVEPGQILVRIDNTQAMSVYQKSRSEYLSLLAEVARLQAEGNGGQPEFPSEVVREGPELVQREVALFNSRKAGLENDVAILKRQITQKAQELAESKTRIQGLVGTSALLRRELEMNRPLLKSGATSEGAILAMERRLAEEEANLANARMAVPRLEEALAEARQRVTSRELAFRNESLEHLSVRMSRVNVMREAAPAEQDRVRRTEVVSPVRGVVKQINLTTLGSVIPPGATILEVTPVEDDMLIEAWVAPQDVADLRPGLPARVVITAYDPSVYGLLEGVLEDMSADTISQEGGEARYRLLLRARSRLMRGGQVMPIIPGMTASVDIVTGKRTILSYLINPILKAKRVALTER